MSSLEFHPIGKFVEPVANWNPLREDPEEIFQYIDLSAIDQNTKSITGAREVSCAEAPSRARQIVKSSDILVSTVRPNLNGVAKVPTELDSAIASTGFCVLRPHQDLLDSSYLFHWVKSPQFVSAMVKKATGASYPAVTDKIVMTSYLPYFPITEQRRIAAILDQADVLRLKRRKALAELDNLKESIFIEMFGNPITNQKNWPQFRLKNVVSLFNGRAFKTEEWEELGLPIIRIQNLNDASKPFNYTTQQFPKKFKVMPNEILFSWSGTPGTSFGCFRWRGGEGWLNQHIFKVSVDRSKLEGDFFIYQMNIRLSELISKAHGGVGLQHVTKGMIDETKLIIPPLSAQQEFSARLEAAHALEIKSKEALDEHERLFASIQHQSFQGEL